MISNIPKSSSITKRLPEYQHGHQYVPRPPSQTSKTFSEDIVFGITRRITRSSSLFFDSDLIIFFYPLGFINRYNLGRNYISRCCLSKTSLSEGWCWLWSLCPPWGSPFSPHLLFPFSFIHKSPDNKNHPVPSCILLLQLSNILITFNTSGRNSCSSLYSFFRTSWTPIRSWMPMANLTWVQLTRRYLQGHINQPQIPTRSIVVTFLSILKL